MATRRTAMCDAPSSYRFGWAFRENNNTWLAVAVTLTVMLFLFNVTVIGVRPSRTVASLNAERYENLMTVGVGVFKTKAELAGSTDKTLRDRARPYMWGFFFLACVGDFLLVPVVFRDEAGRALETTWHKFREQTGKVLDLPDNVPAGSAKAAKRSLPEVVKFIVADLGMESFLGLLKRAFRGGNAR